MFDLICNGIVTTCLLAYLVSYNILSISSVFRSPWKSSSKLNRSEKKSRMEGTVVSRMRSIVTSKALILFILLLGGSAIIYFGYKFIEQQQRELEQIVFSTELQSGMKEEDLVSDYGGDEVFTLLILDEAPVENKHVIEGLTVVRFDPVSKGADVFSVHPELFMNLQRIPGASVSSLDLTVSRMKDLMIIGDLQNPPIPLAYAVYQVEELLALSIDGYILFPASMHDTVGKLSFGEIPEERVGDVEDLGFEKWSTQWSEYWVEYLSNISLIKVWVNRSSLSSIESNMNVVDLYSFSKDFSGLTEDEVQVLAVEDSDIEEIVDERGDMVSFVGTTAIDGALENIHRDERIDREQARIEILNGTNVDGLGSRYERWIVHIGGDVIRVKNAPGKQQKSFIYVTDPEEYEYTLDRIGTLWDGVEVIEGRPDFITTGDIVIVLGMDF